MMSLSRVLRFAGGLLALTVALNAQSWGQRPYSDPYYRNDRFNEGRHYGQGGYGYGQNQDLIGRVLYDLNNAARYARLDGHESRHFEQSAEKLQEFQERLDRGRFDTGKLDKVIENLEHLAQADRVHPRDRRMLARDLEDLRQFRASRGYYSGYGYRGYRY